jgi:hypothetical protein
MNDDNLETTSIEEGDQKRRNLIIAMVGIVAVGCFALFFLAFFWFRPGQSSPLSKYFPSATPTRRPTRTPAPNQTPLPNLTATQLAWVKPAESPSLASVEEAKTTFESGVVYLETYASVSPEMPEINQPGDVYIYEIPLPGSNQFPVAWSYGWCASQKEIMEDNFKYIQLDFLINESPASLENFAVIDTPHDDGSYCREYAALVDNWPEGVHHLETHVTFTQDVHDGWNLYPAGTHTYLYIVTVER